jgi:hypothetical protein
MGATKVQRLVKSMTAKTETRTPLADEMFLPNHSGDVSHSSLRKTPTQNIDLANKDYVDTKADGVDPDHSHTKLVSPTGTNNDVVIVSDNTSVGIGKTADSGTLNTALPLRLNNNTQIQWDRADGTPVNIFNVDTSDNLIWKLPRNGKKFTVFDPNNNTMMEVVDVGTASETLFNGKVTIDQNGDSESIYIDSEATTANILTIQSPQTTTGRGLFLHSNSSNSSNRELTFMWNQNINATGCTVLYLRQDAAKRCLYIDCNANTNAIQIDMDCNSINNQWAIHIVNDNAGTGLPGGIDMSAFAVNEPLIKARDDAITNPGTLTKQIAVEIAGTVYYLYAYTTGT